MSIILFNKKILDYFLSKKLSDWTLHIAELNISKINYFKGYLELNEIKIKDKENLSNIFVSSIVAIDLDLKSLFSNLVILNNVTVIDPKLYFEIKDLKDGLNETKFVDNLNLIDSISKKKTPKVYPLKKRDKNFLILNIQIKNSKAIIKYPKNIDGLEIKLSEISFNKVGNAGKNDSDTFQHYKDVLKIILNDIFFRIPDENLRRLIKKIYKIK